MKMDDLLIHYPIKIIYYLNFMLKKSSLYNHYLSNSPFLKNKKFSTKDNIVHIHNL